MKKLAIAIGHGRTPEGGHHPGSVSDDPKTAKRPDYVEHDLATQIVEAVTGRLRQMGVPCISEADFDARDPNYVGTTKWANTHDDVDAVVEIHLDWERAPRGGFGLYISDAGATLASAVRNAYEEEDLPVRTNQRRSDLYLLRNTKAPALIWECDRVGDGVPVRRIARAIARGLGRYAGVQASSLPRPGSPGESEERERPRRQEPKPFEVRVERPDLLRRGSRDDGPRGSGGPVAQVQALLWAHGLGSTCKSFNGTFDGVYGNATAEAVRAFQEAHDLDVDGIVGKRTLRALLAA